MSLQHFAETGSGSWVSFLLCHHTSESCPASGVICTWPASPGLEMCREEGNVGKGRKEDSEQRKPAGVAMLGKTSGAVHTGKKLESGWEEGRIKEGK